jgi:hypothetical protein
VAELESPDPPELIYRYRREDGDVPLARPLLQGDIFERVSIPGVEEEPGPAIVLSHACTMRRGATLRSHLMMARVVRSSEDSAHAWQKNYRVCPLPILLAGGENCHAVFEEAGRVRTSELSLATRLACLDDYGLAVLQQRYIHHLTRLKVELEALHDENAPVLLEIELLEEWQDAASAEEPGEEGLSRAAGEFDAFFGPYRALALERTQHTRIRQVVRREYRQRYGG